MEFAVLGLLQESPMHGYELRKRLNALLGSFRAFSYGSLYPCLKDLEARGWIVADGSTVDEPATLAGRRSKIVYKLTAEGKEAFAELASQTGPSAWEDDSFGVHFAFFSRTDAQTRLRILEGRRSRLEDRLDSYTLELQRHGLESVEREVRWLNELIATERDNAARVDVPGADTQNKE
jgi:DNA-binding PadR family transcriptional regulator